MAQLAQFPHNELNNTLINTSFQMPFETRTTTAQCLSPIFYESGRKKKNVSSKINQNCRVYWAVFFLHHCVHSSEPVLDLNPPESGF